MSTYPVLRSQLANVFGQHPDFWSQAEESWGLTADEQHKYLPAISIPGQIERIDETIFGSMDHTIRALTRSEQETVGPTMVLRFRDVLLYDGVLFKNGATHHLSKRKHILPPLKQAPRLASGAIYDSWVGVRYFGNWLMDDCETYRLAEEAGQPVTIQMETSGHRQQYEQLLGISPLRTDFAHFEELILFRDLPNNSNKKARAADRRRRLLASIPPEEPHPGVFLMRGKTGDPRLLVNEEALAEGLAKRHGLRILRILDHPVETLIKACAGAKLLVGVEGSQLVHALAVMPAGGSMVTLMPPDRVTAALKLMTDRLDLNFAFLIGTGTTGGFEINPNEIEATLDLLP